MNITEHVWAGVKEEAWRTKPKNLELWEACKTSFAIPDDFINKLGKSLSNCMNAVHQAHGSQTR